MLSEILFAAPASRTAEMGQGVFCKFSLWMPWPLVVQAVATLIYVFSILGNRWDLRIVKLIYGEDKLCCQNVSQNNLSRDFSSEMTPISVAFAIFIALFI